MLLQTRLRLPSCVAQRGAEGSGIRLAGLVMLLWALVPTDADGGIRLFPPTTPYSPYLADPTRPTFSYQFSPLEHSSTIDVSKRMTHIKLGMDSSLAEARLLGQPWQLGLLGGFRGGFDNGRSLDNLGWDGIYGLHVVTGTRRGLAWRFGTKHISSHVGDEYAERTGRERIDYTREEVRSGLAWGSGAALAAYGEVGYACKMRNEDLQEPWRAQVGCQYISNAGDRDETLGWYAAIDLSCYEEDDWDANTCMQLGLLRRSGARRWRLAVEMYNGRRQIGEFFQDRERYVGVGVWCDP